MFSQQLSFMRDMSILVYVTYGIDREIGGRRSHARGVCWQYRERLKEQVIRKLPSQRQSSVFFFSAFKRQRLGRKPLPCHATHGSMACLQPMSSV